MYILTLYYSFLFTINSIIQTKFTQLFLMVAYTFYKDIINLHQSTIHSNQQRWLSWLRDAATRLGLVGALFDACTRQPRLPIFPI